MIAHYATEPAAECWNVWGAYAARQYAINNGVPLELLTLARYLRAATRTQLARNVLNNVHSNPLLNK